MTGPSSGRTSRGSASELGGLIVFTAHPDDEFFCAGLIGALTHRGIPVHLVCWTGGEGGMSRRTRLLLTLPKRFHPRRIEMRRSARHLGATSLTFLPYVDYRSKAGLAAPVFDSTALKQEIADLMTQREAGMVVTHGSDGDYGHPAHQVLHRLVREVCCEAKGTSRPLLTFNANWASAPHARCLNQSDRADCVLDSRPYRRQKLQVFFSHRTQVGVLKSMVKESGSSLRELMHATRYEGYHCWNEGPLREQALKRFQDWTGTGSGGDKEISS